MGVDYSGASTASYAAAKSSLNILKVAPTLAYNGTNFGIGISPVIQYGTLAISYVSQSGSYNPNNNSDAAIGFGGSIGAYYDIVPGLTVAAAYDSQISTSYGNQLSGAGTGFGQTFGNGLNQPAQIKGGISYSATEHIILTADYKLVQWGDATGYKEFGWKNQNVFAVGAKYSANNYWLGLGYNKGNNPIGTFSNGVPANTNNGKNGIGNYFNNAFFPAIVTNSYTFGGGYNLTQNTELSGAYVYSPKVTTTVNVSDVGAATTNTTTHSQQAFSVSLRYKFD
jgi:long-chain fatty acid transport protein